MEVFRRVLLLTGLLGAIWCALELTMADGRKIRILLDSLPDAERLLEVLNQQGIPGQCSA